MTYFYCGWVIDHDNLFCDIEFVDRVPTVEYYNGEHQFYTMHGLVYIYYVYDIYTKLHYVPRSDI